MRKDVIVINMEEINASAVNLINKIIVEACKTGEKYNLDLIQFRALTYEIFMEVISRMTKLILLYFEEFIKNLIDMEMGEHGN